MTEINWNDLPLPPHERFIRGQHGGIKVTCDPDGGLYSHIGTLHPSEQERWCALAIVAFEEEAERVDLINIETCDECDVCVAPCETPLGSEVRKYASAHFCRLHRYAAVWRAAYRAMREEQEKCKT